MKWVYYVSVMVLIIIQYNLSPHFSIFSYSEVDKIEIRQRMSDYPPNLYRLANILENRPEFLLFYRLQKNFFNIFNINPKTFILIPFILIGFFYQIDKRKYIDLIVSLVFPLVFLTILGSNQPRGYFSLYPFLIISLYYGLVKLVKKI